MLAKEAYRIFKKKYPNRTVVEAADYDSSHYLFAAVENPNEVDYNNPNFLIDKRTGAIQPFSPMRDLRKFQLALRDRPIDVGGFR